MTEGVFKKTDDSLHCRRSVCGGKSFAYVGEFQDHGLMILAEGVALKPRADGALESRGLIYYRVGKVGKSFSLLVFAEGMEAVVKLSVAPKVIGYRYRL